MTITADTYSKDVGQTVTIPCTISGTVDRTPPLMTSSWTFNGNPVTTGGRFSISSTDSNNPELTITSLEFSDEGSYTCSATNAAGTNSDSASLVVTGSKLLCFWYVILTISR